MVRGSAGVFDRPGLYNEHQVDYPDNSARFTFFSKAAFLLARHLPQRVDLVQCHDWQTGLLPIPDPPCPGRGRLGRRSKNPVHDSQPCLSGLVPGRGLGPHQSSRELVPLGSALHYQWNSLKGGLALSDALATVSPNYAREICTPEYGCGLDGLLRRREYRAHRDPERRGLRRMEHDRQPAAAACVFRG